MNKEVYDERMAQADGYDNRTGSQPSWYGKKSSLNKRLFQTSSLLIVLLGAVIGVAPVLFGDSTKSISNVEIITSIIGALIVILKGFERIWLPEEKWINYRKAAESLKREREKYVEGVSPYEGDDSEAIYKLYVNRCIFIKAEEQNNFWGLGGTKEIEKIAHK